MKYLVYISMAWLVGCGSGGGGADSASSAAVPAAAPAASPAAPTIAKSSSFNGYECDIYTDGSLKCSDGFQPTDGHYIQIAVGNGIACAINNPVGDSPSHCSNLTDGGCSNPYANSVMHCWDQGSGGSTYTLMVIRVELGYAGAEGEEGAMSVNQNSDGSIWVEVEVYDKTSTPPGQFIVDDGVTGTSIDTGLGFLE